MGFINLAEKTISAKLVYYGCGMGGKTTSLRAVHEIMCPRNEVQLVSIKTEEDATLLFDFLPIDLGQVEGFKIRIQGFTVPGQPKYRAMRKYVLQGADAVVLVVDSEASRLEENQQSLQSLRENLKSNGIDPNTIPVVMQYNKRDLEDILSERELDLHFKVRKDVVAFPTVATERRGVFETFVHAAGLLVEAKVKLYGLGQGGVDPEAVAEGARRKLWEICDSQRGEVASDKKKKAGSFELTFDEEGRRSKGRKKAAADHKLDEVFTDEELDVDLDLSAIADGLDEDVDLSRVTDDEMAPALLDAALESNVEMAKRFGDLDEYKTLLVRKNRELVQVAQDVVHDLKRPLSAIRLMFSSMRKGFLGELPDHLSSAVDNGLVAVDQMERLINDLMDSSRLDFDGVRLDFQDIDMALLVAKVLNSLRYEIDERDVGVRVEPMPVISADEWALTKVFMNLIGNAIQYCHSDRPARIWVSAEDDFDRWVFCVRDNGIGVPAQDRGRLFKRFERGVNTGGISGTGLGLHIVRELLLGHGGDVWLESKEGQGTTFFLSIPHEPVQPRHCSVSDVNLDHDRERERDRDRDRERQQADIDA